MTATTSCAIWRKSDQPQWSSGAHLNDDRIVLVAGQNYCKKVTRTTSGACSRKGLCTYRAVSAPNLALTSMYFRPATFLAQLPWLGIYISHIPVAVKPLNEFILHGQRFAMQRLERGSTTRDLFHYLVIGFSIRASERRPDSSTSTVFHLEQRRSARTATATHVSAH